MEISKNSIANNCGLHGLLRFLFVRSFWSSVRIGLQVRETKIQDPYIIRFNPPDKQEYHMNSDARRRKRTEMNSLLHEDDDGGRGRKLFPLRRIVLVFLLISFGTLYFLRQSLRFYVYQPVIQWLVRPPPKPEPQPRYELRTSFSNDPTSQIHQKYHSMMDTCRILQQCFVGSDVYGTPEVCKRNLDPTIRYYESGFWVEMVEGKEDRLVGFLSIHHDVSYKGRKNNQQPDDYHALVIYNVCVDEERRGKGIAKKLIPEFIDATIKHYKLEKYAKATGKEIDPKTGKPIPPLIVGLDVDLTSDLMPDAFSLYTKLGFVRWWTPCISVARHKWTSLIETQASWYESKQGYSAAEKRDEHGNVKRNTGLLPARNADFPLARLLWDPAPYLENSFNLGTGKKPNHFCMYKFYSDSFITMAKSLMESSKE